LSATRVVLYRDDDGAVAVIEWLDSLPTRARDKCTVRIERLAELGHRVRRPEADYLGNGIYELRAKHMGVNLRMLYFFHGRAVAVLSHGFAKQQARVPAAEIAIALRRKSAFESDPTRHTHEH
jgi:phage-related protein